MTDSMHIVFREHVEKYMMEHGVTAGVSTPLPTRLLLEVQAGSISFVFQSSRWIVDRIIPGTYAGAENGLKNLRRLAADVMATWSE
jgi:hypothetical protein